MGLAKSMRWISTLQRCKPRWPTRAPNGVHVKAALPHAARDGYALVLANILTTPLQMLAPLLFGHVAAGGDLVLAGMLERQANALREHYAPYCALDIRDREDGWILMSATRSARPP